MEFLKSEQDSEWSELLDQDPEKNRYPPPPLSQDTARYFPLNIYYGRLCVKEKFYFSSLVSVFGICDILVRVRIRGSVPLTNGSGSESIFQWL